MDYVVLDGVALNQGYHANPLVDLAGETGITFGASEIQMEQLSDVSTGITLGTNGDLAVLAIFAGGTTGITFNVTATGEFYVENYLSGDTGLSIDLVGDLTNYVGLSGTTDITTDAASTLAVEIHFSGSTTLTFNISGDLYAKVSLLAQTALVITVDGELWVNPFAAEDDDRTFRRPMLVKEFRRQ